MTARSTIPPIQDPSATPSEVERGGAAIDGDEPGPAEYLAVEGGMVLNRVSSVLVKMQPAELRMDLLIKIMSGSVGAKDIREIAKLTAREKAYLVGHAWFKDLYDARLLDLFIGARESTLSEIRVMEMVCRRVGAAKPTTQVNVQVNNSQRKAGDVKDDAVKIRVQRPS